MNPLIHLKKLGQSVWYDNLRRGLITSGELERMIDEYGLMGVTSNPTIFERAIAGTSEYDQEIARLVYEGLEDTELLKRLFMDDVSEAARIFLPVFREAGGRDGFVSIEVRPAFARNAAASIKEAREYFAEIDRPNIMIKIPATVEGLQAIEELTYEGYNINVTLLFSVTRYEEVALAYIKGLERRLEEGKPVDRIASVASFFVSRVDTIADRMIEEKIERASSNDERSRLKALFGRVAAANAKTAFVKYKGLFEGERFRKLTEAGAHPQRLLWASTGTKNPHYRDVKYVEELIGAGTVNTMPLNTLLAFYDHGKASVTLDKGLDDARKVIDDFCDLGLDYNYMTHRLEEEGIKAFADSYDALLKCVKEKKDSLVKSVRSVEYSIGGFDPMLKSTLEEIENEGFLERLWAKDPTLWTTDPDGKKLIRNALGWLTLPEVMEEHVDTINAFASEIKEAGFSHVVLLGMGGSSLAPLVLAESFGRQPGWPELIVLDSTDPEAVKSAEGRIDLGKSLFIISSKSGSTIEPLSLFEYFHNKMKEGKGAEAGRNFMAITDPGTPLEGFSKKYGMRKVFLNPKDIGGRFSALSYFGLVPAALAGIDISKLLYYGSRIEASVQPCITETQNPAIKLGAFLGEASRSGRDKVTFFLSDEIATFGLWIEQLVAESTGKEGKGIVPVTGEPVSSPGFYGKDRVFVYIGLGPENKKTKAALSALSEAGHPVLKFHLGSLYELGGEFLRWEVATSVAGQLLGINPFDQPDVELSKKLTLARLNSIGKKGGEKPPGVEVNGRGFELYFGKAAYEGIKEKGFKNGDSRSALKKYFSLLGEGDYLGILAYFNPADASIEKALSRLRKTVRDSTKAATQFGFGPRYLHSTGQLHKGGANKGLFLILCHEPRTDMEVPNSPFTFSELELSQAFGDMEALDTKGCRVALVKLREMSRAALNEAITVIEEAAQ